MENYSNKDFFACPKCRKELNFNNNLFLSYFCSADITCPTCNKSHDLWKIFMNLLDQPSITFASHYSILGCEQRITQIDLKPNEVYKLDLSDEIDDGDLLYINYTSNVGVHPIQLHSNTLLPTL